MQRDLDYYFSSYFLKAKFTSIYKPYILKSIIKIIHQWEIENQVHNNIIPYDDISYGLLSLTWNLHRNWKITFLRKNSDSKSSSKLFQILESLPKNIELNSRDDVSNVLLTQINNQVIKKYAIYKLWKDFSLFNFVDRKNQQYNFDNEKEYNVKKTLIVGIFIPDPIWKWIRKNYYLIKYALDFQIVIFLESINDNQIIPQLAFKVKGDIKRKNLKKPLKNYIINYQNNQCFYCEITLKNSNIHFDHFIPWSFYPTTELAMMVATCESCNLTKSNKIPAEIYFTKLLDRNQNKAFLNSIEIFIERNRVENSIIQLSNYFRDSNQMFENNWSPTRDK